SRHPGAERALRPVRHEQGEEREDSEGHRSGVADARGVRGAARGRAGTGRTPRQEEGRASGGTRGRRRRRGAAAGGRTPQEDRDEEEDFERQEDDALEGREDQEEGERLRSFRGARRQRRG